MNLSITILLKKLFGPKSHSKRVGREKVLGFFLTLLSIAGIGASISSCSTGTRAPSADPGPLSQSFQEFSKSLKLNAYFANLHAHHMMDEKIQTDFDCAENGKKLGTFLYDDGRPCRSYQKPVLVGEGLTPYFEEACHYAKEKGELDILFVTPHTKAERKNVKEQANTPRKDLELRHGLLKKLNQKSNGQFLCGMGQEASSIAAGNHIGIFGQFPQAGKPHPVLFESGDFKNGYEEVRKAKAEGHQVILQLNHPGALRDVTSLFETEKGKSKFSKDYFNDYGIDDFLPGKCSVFKEKLRLVRELQRLEPTSVDTILRLEAKVVAEFGENVSHLSQEEVDSRIKVRLEQDCKGVSASDAEFSQEGLQKTYANIREASGDSFKLMELFYPRSATSNQAEEFISSHKRSNNNVQAEMKDDAPVPIHLLLQNQVPAPGDPLMVKADMGNLLMGAYNYIYYLSMGFKIGPTANQDNHMMNWGTATANRTGVLAADLKEETVLSALEQRRTFASEDRNAKVIFAAQDGQKLAVMGSEFKTKQSRLMLKIAYFDPDPSDQEAGIRVYYYQNAEPVNIPIAGSMIEVPGKTQGSSYVNGAVNFAPGSVSRIIEFKDSRGELPIGEPSGFLATTWTSDEDPLVVSNSVKQLQIPLEVGSQFVFVEITQKGDLDRIYTAPIWITRE